MNDIRLMRAMCNAIEYILEPEISMSLDYYEILYKMRDCGIVYEFNNCSCKFGIDDMPELSESELSQYIADEIKLRYEEYVK